MLWKKLYEQLSAVEALYVVDKTRPYLNERGVRVLQYLRKRRGRYLAPLAALALALFAGDAHAQFRSFCFFGGGTGYCTASTGPTYDANVIRVPQPTAEEVEESRARRDKWLAFCEPRLSAPHPSTGVQRWLYKHPGCDVGRSE